MCQPRFVGFQPYELFGQHGQLAKITVGIACLDHIVPVLHIAQFPHAEGKAAVETLTCHLGARRKKANERPFREACCAAPPAATPPPCRRAA